MKTLLTIAALLVGGTVAAQEYKLAKTSGTLELRDLNNVAVEGHSGSEIIFLSTGRKHEDDERAAGLRAISSMGLEDNTGIGLSVVDKGELVVVNQLKKMDGPRITIKVPKGVKVSYTHTTPYGQEFRIKNFEGALEISTVHSGVMAENVSGPMQIKTVHGDIDLIMGTAVTNPASITSVHGHVDVAIPAAAKVNLTLSTQWGEILVDPDFKIEVQTEGNMRRYSDKVRGTLNGGGVDLELASGHSNVYLRKRP